MAKAKRRSGLAGAALRLQPDVRLTALARSGYRRAFEEIARRYRATLTSYAGTIVPEHRAEDVVQEAFVKAYRSLPKSEEEPNLRPWLYAIVRNTALNDLRDERAHEHLDESWDGVAQPAEVAAQRAELAALVAGIQDLPTPQREALVKRELEGRSHEEIAAMLGATPGAVRGLIFRARTALRDGAGLLIPMPALRALLDAGPMPAETAGIGIGGTAAGLGAGGAGGIAAKAGTALVVAGLAVGPGLALRDHGHGRDAATAATAQGGHRGAAGRIASGGPGPSGEGWSSGSGHDDRHGGHGEGGGDEGHGSDDRGGGHDGGEGSEQEGSGTSGHGGSSGSGSGSSGSGSGSSGSGSGSTGSGSGSSGSGSGSSGSGSGSSGSGSGSSGSGSGSSGSGSGSSGSGSSDTGPDEGGDG